MSTKKRKVTPNSTPVRKIVAVKKVHGRSINNWCAPSKLTLRKIENLINTCGAEFSFKRTNNTLHVSLTTGNISNIVMVKDEDIDPKKHLRLNVFDFYMLFKWFKKGKINLFEWNVKKICFYTGPPISKNNQPEDRYYICLEEVDKGWRYFPREEEYMNNNSYWVACLDKSAL
jgi:hypothetical protein